jgi:hypothetical protein
MKDHMTIFGSDRVSGQGPMSDREWPELSDLIKGLDHDDYRIREKWSRKLREMGIEAAFALGRLLRSMMNGAPDALLTKMLRYAVERIGNRQERGSSNERSAPAPRQR